MNRYMNRSIHILYRYKYQNKKKMNLVRTKKNLNNRTLTFL